MAQIIDVILVLTMFSAVASGIFRGFLGNVGNLLGCIAGGIAGWWVLPWINSIVPWPQWRIAIIVASGVALLAIGSAIGGIIAGFLRRGVERIHLGLIDRILGGVVGLIISALALSLIGQTIATIGIPGLSASVSSSAVLRTINGFIPPPVERLLAQLRQGVLSDGLPQLGALLEEGGATSTQPPIDLRSPALTLAAASVARISGTSYACSETISGSGFVIAPNRIITNAHVVQGITSPIVDFPGRDAREGRVVYYDPHHDLAVIAVDDLPASVIKLGPTLQPGDAAVVMGYPFGGPLTEGSATVDSRGKASIPDIGDPGRTEREIYALHADVNPGNSGGPLLDAKGEAVGIVFARSDNTADTGYAMTPAELLPVIQQASDDTRPVPTGSCSRD